MTQQRPAIFNDMAALSDGVRSRLLLLLENRELTVSELCVVVRLPQSTTSRHLKILADQGWVRSRADGTRRLYTMVAGSADSRELWALLRRQVADEPAAVEDARRLEAALRDRRLRSSEFFNSTGGDWDRLRDGLFGERFYFGALLGLLDDDWTVGDLGCGTGRTAEALAPFVRKVIAIDGSQAMLDAAAKRLDGVQRVELRRGELENLPLEPGTLDAATLVLALHHVPDPALVLSEAERVLAPRGRLLIVDMLPHDHREYLDRMGHVWAGFSQERLEKFIGEAGLALRRFETLPPDPEADGPLLFAAACVRDGCRKQTDGPENPA